MREHLPILVIIVPLLTALAVPLAARVKRILAWYLTLISTAVSCGLSFDLLLTVMRTGKVSYWLSGWEPPWGIEYAVDYLNAFVLCIVTCLGFLVAVYARRSVEHEVEEHRTGVFYATYLLFVTGLAGIVITGDIFNLYVFLEICSLAGYALIAVGRKREALVASYNYLILGSLGAIFVLLGTGYLYMVTGSLNMADLAARLPALYHSKVVQTAFAFFVIGLGIKVALFPLHTWLPNAYTYAPSAVSAIMAATGTKVAAYAFIRVMFTVFGTDFVIYRIHTTQILLVLSVVAILAGSVLAIAQTNIKKMLAYSSISQVGYIVLGIALLTPTGIKGSLLHILNHALMKGCLFLVVGAVVYRTGLTSIEDFKGLGKKMPVSMAAFTVAALSMIGVPLTVGFVSKWYLVLAAIETGLWPVVAVLLLSSLLMAVYFWRVIDNLYFVPAVEPAPELRPSSASHSSNPHEVRDAPALMLWPTVISAALCVIFGIIPFLPLAVAEKAVSILLR
jgi:multicomponent Na+:H+ antiporter subunit D